MDGISHAKEDLNIAQRLYNDLKEKKLFPWLSSKDILPGQKIKATINDAIRKSDYFLALLSSNSVTKKGYIHKELKIALDIMDEYPSPLDIFIIPVRIDECNPFNDKLHDYHWVDLFPTYIDGFNKILTVFSRKKSFENQNEVIKNNFGIGNDLEADALKIQKPNVSRFLTSEIPHINTVEIVGREAEIIEIEKIIEEKNKLVLVNGLGGIGKTVVAKLYLEKNIDKFVHIAWINCGYDLKSSFIQNDTLVKNLDLNFSEDDEEDTRFNIIMNAMQNLDGPNLLIIDNLNEEVGKNIESLKYYWKILVTSRKKLNYFEHYNLDILKPEYATSLFKMYYFGKSNDKDIQTLLKYIGYHTLTIELLAKTLEKSYKLEKKGGIISLINYFVDGRLDDNDLKIKIQTQYDIENITIYTCLMNSFDLIDLDNTEKKLLIYFSVLPSFDIHVEDLSNLFQVDEDFENEYLINPLHSLIAKGWLMSKEKYYYKAHQVVQEVIRYKLKPTAIDCRHLIHSLSKEFLVQVGKNPLNKGKFIPFGEYLLSFINEENKEIATLCDNFAKTLRYFGYNEKALNYALRALRIRENLFSKYHNDIGTSYINIAVIYRYMGQFEPALEYGIKALELYENMPGEKNYVKIATACYKITLTYIKLGDLNKALEYSHKDLSALEKGLNEEHPYFAETFNTRGVIYRKIGDLIKSREYIEERALPIREKMLENDHPDLATSYYELSITYYKLFDNEKAKHYINKALEIRKKILPETHSDLAECFRFRNIIYS
jgi:tetratricopeptide (TPR) repeat protein